MTRAPNAIPSAVHAASIHLFARPSPKVEKPFSTSSQHPVTAVYSVFFWHSLVVWRKNVAGLVLLGLGVCACGSTTSSTPTTTSAKAAPASSTAAGGNTPAPADARANPGLSGNQSPALPAGIPGKLVVVASGNLTQMVPNDIAASLDLPVVVRNNTRGPESGITVTATAHDNSGALVGTGDSQGNVVPITVEPGQIVIVDVFFQAKPPADAQVSFSVGTQGVNSNVSLLVTQSNTTPVPGGFVDLIGTVKNQTSHSLTSSPTVVGMCFSSTGQPLAMAVTSTDGNGLAAGATSPFSSQVFGSTPACPVWLVGATGSTF